MRIFSCFAENNNSRNVHANQLIIIVEKPKEGVYGSNINKVRLPFGVIKVIKPCVEGDRSDFSSRHHCTQSSG